SQRTAQEAAAALARAEECVAAHGQQHAQLVAGSIIADSSPPHSHLRPSADTYGHVWTRMDTYGHDLGMPPYGSLPAKAAAPRRTKRGSCRSHRGCSTNCIGSPPVSSCLLGKYCRHYVFALITSATLPLRLLAPCGGRLLMLQRRPTASPPGCPVG